MNPGTLGAAAKWRYTPPNAAAAAAPPRYKTSGARYKNARNANSKLESGVFRLAAIWRVRALHFFFVYRPSAPSTRPRAKNCQLPWHKRMHEFDSSLAGISASGDATRCSGSHSVTRGGLTRYTCVLGAHADHNIMYANQGPSNNACCILRSSTCGRPASVSICAHHSQNYDAYARRSQLHRYVIHEQ